jgi:hypothetical protein
MAYRSKYISTGLWPFLTMKNCTKGKPCGKACIKKNYNCRDAPTSVNVPACSTGKHCGKSCISQNKTCKDAKNIERTLVNSDAAAWWMARREAGGRHTQWGYPPPQNTCYEAKSNLEKDIITQEAKANPTASDCKVARYFCNPSTKGGYGGSRVGYSNVLRKCS